MVLENSHSIVNMDNSHVVNFGTTATTNVLTSKMENSVRMPGSDTSVAGDVGDQCLAFMQVHKNFNTPRARPRTSDSADGNPTASHPQCRDCLVDKILSVDK